MKHIPQRTCISCREQKDKSELLRIVRSPDGSYAVDRSGKAEGRGAYVCDNGKCLAEAVKKRALNRVFKTQISDTVYAELLKIGEKHGE